MLVFWRQRLVFLATPKTASTSIEEVLAPLAAMVVLRPPQLKHTNAHRFHRFLMPYLTSSSDKEFALTALMREPRDWLNSWYRYRQRPDEVDDKTTRHMSFDDFVQAYCLNNQPEFAKVGMQSNFLAPPNKPAVDHVFRYENMGDFLMFLEHRLETRINLPKLNISPTGDDHLSAPTLALLHKTCARDFDIYESLGRA
jgi:hypothetical protein